MGRSPSRPLCDRRDGKGAGSLTYRPGAQKLLLQSVASCFGGSKCSDCGSATLFVLTFMARGIVGSPYYNRAAVI